MAITSQERVGEGVPPPRAGLAHCVGRKLTYRFDLIADREGAPGALFDAAEGWGRAHG